MREIVNDGRIAYLDEFALRGEVHAIVQECAPGVRDELITESSDLTVKDQTLKIHVCKAEDGHSWGVVAATALESDEPVLDDIDTSNSVDFANLVQGAEQLDGLGLLALGGDKLGWETLLEVDGDLGGLIGSVPGIVCHDPHVIWWAVRWVLQNASFIRAVSHVLVHAPWLSLGCNNGNVGLLAVVEEIVAARKAFVEFGVPPWGNDLDAGLNGEESEFEADLIVALACAAVADEVAVLALGGPHLATSNHWAGETGSEEVAVRCC